MKEITRCYCEAETGAVDITPCLKSIESLAIEHIAMSDKQKAALSTLCNTSNGMNAERRLNDLADLLNELYAFSNYRVLCRAQFGF